MRIWLGMAAALAATTPLVAQDDDLDAQSIGQNEVVVTASRRGVSNYDAQVPVIGLRRRADFALMRVTVTGDTREAEKRREEMYAMIRGAIQLAGQRGIELAVGSTLVEPLTLANYKELTFQRDARPDAERVSFLIKTPLSAAVDGKTAQARMAAFVKAVPAVGRALMSASDELTLSVVKPDQYRDQIVALVAADANALAGKFGAGYAVNADGVDRPVEWNRAGLTDVFLYVPYRLTVVPR